MIPQTDQSWQGESWQSALKNLVTSSDELCKLLELNPKQLDLSSEAASQFALKVPRSFVARMEIGNPSDPLLRQVLSLKDELLKVPGFAPDPLQEQDSNPLPGLIHKYKNRVLLTLSGTCAIHCRYCFRRHFNYHANNPGSDGWLPVLRYLQGHPEIDEVIFSGGDPLSAPDRTLKRLTEQLQKISNLNRLRVHTRFPVVIPQRITEECIDWLNIFPNTVMVLHINHANEIDENVALAVSRLKAAGITLLNQTVLLKGVNDRLKDQLNLHQNCFDLGIQPYYLHMLDPVEGSAHFELEEASARELYEEMRSSLSGYILPRLVRETPGDSAKTML